MSVAGRQGFASLATYAPLALYLLALNPWFIPNQHDDVLYYFGAESLLHGDGFALGGRPITDWPPGFPLALAAAFGVLGKSIWIAKLTVIAFVAAGIWLTHRCARIYELPCPRLVAALTGLLPISLICGAGILSEWPYLAVSMAFLWALHRLRDSRKWHWILLAGALLAIASLTRWVGVFLGAALLTQAYRVLREGGLRSVLPEAAAAFIGASVWIGWKLRCLHLVKSGEAPSGAYDRPDYYLERFTHLEPLALLQKIESVLFSASKVAAAMHLPWLGTVAALVLGVALAWGVVVRLRQRGVTPIDTYVAVLLLLLLGDLNKPERYFAPMAPFLIGYLLTAIEAVLRHAPQTWAARAAAASAGAWVALLLALDGYLLFFGNRDGTRGGFSMLASPSIEEFYRGEALDLYHALRWADENIAAGPIATLGVHGKFVLAFTGRGYRTLPDDSAEGTVGIVVLDAELPPGWQRRKQIGQFTIGTKKED